MKASQPGRLGSALPNAAEVGSAQWAILRPGKHEAVLAKRRESLQVRDDLR
jgi:hypothetical protein